MKPFVLIREEKVVLQLDDFYKAVGTMVDKASPPAHMACDWLTDPMGLGLVVYPPRVYEKIEELKKCQESK